MTAPAALTIACILALWCAVAPVVHAGPATWGAGPTLVADDQDHTELGARFHLSWKDQRHIVPLESFPWSHDHYLAAQYLWVPSEVVVPSQTEFALGLGASLSLSKPRPPAPIDTPLDVVPSPYDFNYGSIGGRIHAQYEASANRSEHAMAGGAEIFYRFPEKPLVPSLRLMFDAVKPLQSDVRDSAGLDDELYERFTARAYWVLTRKRFTGEVDASWFRSAGLNAALEALGWKSGAALEARLSGRIGLRPPGPIALNGVFIQYANGQMPTAPTSTSAWTLGIDFATK